MAIEIMANESIIVFKKMWIEKYRKHQYFNLALFSDIRHCNECKMKVLNL